MTVPNTSALGSGGATLVMDGTPAATAAFFTNGNPVTGSASTIDSRGLTKMGGFPMLTPGVSNYLTYLRMDPIPLTTTLERQRVLLAAVSAHAA